MLIFLAGLMGAGCNFLDQGSYDYWKTNLGNLFIASLSPEAGAFQSSGTDTGSTGSSGSSFFITTGAATASTTLNVSFSAAPDGAAAVVLANYCVTTNSVATFAACAPNLLSAAAPSLTGSTVTLTLASGVSSGTYYIWVQNITSSTGQALANSSTSFTLNPFNVNSASSSGSTSTAVTFSEAPAAGSGGTPGNYCITSTSGAGSFGGCTGSGGYVGAVTGASVGGSTVTLTTPAIGSGTYYLWVQNVTSSSLGLAMTTNNVSFSIVPDLTGIVINEIGWDTSAAADDFIELYNPGSFAIDLAAATAHIQRDSDCNLSSGSPDKLALTGSIPAGGYYLLARDTGIHAGSADQTFTFTLNADDCVALTSSSTNLTATNNSHLVDFVAFGNAVDRENGSVAPGSKTLSRCPNGTDTNDNGADFLSRPTSIDAANNCTVVDLSPLKINEVVWDTGGTTTQDFVEIYNSGTSAIDLGAAGAYIMRDSGCNLGNGVTAIVALTGTINAGSYFTISNDATGYGGSANQTNMGNIDDGYCVAILSSSTAPTSPADSQVIDFVAIGTSSDATYRENASYAPGGASNGQNSRCPDGNDSDVNANDFSSKSVSQGGTNNCVFNVTGATSASNTSVQVTFSDPPHATSSTTLGNYCVTTSAVVSFAACQASGGVLSLSGTPTLAGSTVTVTTAAQSLVTYNVWVQNVTSANGGIAMTTANASFTGSIAAATALINEVMCVGSAGPEDFIELYVTGSGSLAGFRILENGTGTLRYTFGANLAVTAGDYVVLHFDSGNQGGFAQEDDAASTINESAGTDSSATAWDVYVATASLTCTDNFIQLQNASSVTVDSVAISNRDGDATAAWMTNFATVFGATATYLWTGFSVLPVDGSNDATIQGEAAGDIDLGAGQSVQRDSDYTPLGGGIRDTNTNVEWCMGAHTMGAANVNCP
ncbi:MAG: lamin tail domain-containing protein [Spirochaetales bacterium]|nr:lamin tail domain-containing protein [Spirochaetales bacterium]